MFCELLCRRGAWRGRQLVLNWMDSHLEVAADEKLASHFELFK